MSLNEQRLTADLLKPLQRTSAIWFAWVLLLVAIVAAIALTLRSRAGHKVQDISKQVAVKASDRIRIVKMEAEKRS